MQEGVIRRIFSYYLESEKFKEEIERAKRIFFDAEDDSTVITIDDVYEPFFLEWLIYDYKMEKSKKTLLENFYDTNPKKLPLIKLQVYKDMQENEYAPFEALEINKGEGMRIRSLLSGNVYDVREKSATYDLKENIMFFARAGKVGDHYELIGADSFAFDFEMGTGLKKFLKNPEDKFTPKEAVQIYLNKGNAGDKDSEENFVNQTDDIDNLEEAKQALNRILKKNGMIDMVRADTIQSWFQKFEEDNKTGAQFSIVFSLMFNLMNEKSENDKNEILKFVNILYNFTPQKFLQGLSPHEKKQESGQRNKKPKHIVNVERMDKMDWVDNTVKALEFIRKQDFANAVKEYDKTFEVLLRDKSLVHDIYRVFANAGIAYFGVGKEAMGLKSLEYALALNPNYDFAVDTMDKYNNNDYDEFIRLGRLKSIEEDVKAGKQVGPKWNIDDVEKMTDRKILEHFANFDIDIDKDKLRSLVLKSASVDELVSKYFEDDFRKKHAEDIDFLYFALETLWRRWFPDILQAELIFTYIYELGETLNLNRSEKKIKRIISDLRIFLAKCKKPHAEHVRKFKIDLNDLKESLVAIIENSYKCDNEVLSLVSDLRKILNEDIFFLVEIVYNIKYKLLWKKQADTLIKKYKYNAQIVLDIAWINEEDDELHEKYLLKALRAAEERERDKKYKIDYSDTTIFEDYEMILYELIELYDEQGEKKKRREMEKYMDQIFKRRSDIDTTPDFKKVKEMLKKADEKNLQEELAGSLMQQYYDWLLDLNINFQTKELTKTPISNVMKDGAILHENNDNSARYFEPQEKMRDNFGKKIGRNDPCPCGSGKKYKKCCGK